MVYTSGLPLTYRRQGLRTELRVSNVIKCSIITNFDGNTVEGAKVVQVEVDISWNIIMILLYSYRLRGNKILNLLFSNKYLFIILFCCSWYVTVVYLKFWKLSFTRFIYPVESIFQYSFYRTQSLGANIWWTLSYHCNNH